MKLFPAFRFSAFRFSLLASLAFSLQPSAFAQTPVLFPIQSLFGGAAVNKPLTITAANKITWDGQNFWAGTYTIIPASATNPITSLYPGSYLLTVQGVVQAVRFNVPATTNLWTMVPSSGPSLYFGTNFLSSLQFGSGFSFTTNADGSITITGTGGGGGTDTNAVTSIALGVAQAVAATNVPEGVLTNGQASPVSFGSSLTMQGDIYARAWDIYNANGSVAFDAGKISSDGSGNLTVNSLIAPIAISQVTGLGNAAGAATNTMTVFAATNAQNLTGQLSLAQLPFPTVTNRTFLSPMMFGAVGWGINGDATHNDTAAFTACFSAATNFGSVVDLEGRSYYLTNGVTNQVGNMVVRNGTIWVPNNFPGAVFTGPVPGIPVGNGMVWSHLQFFAAGTNANPSSVAIQTKPYGTGYGTDATISYCLCSNFWRFVTIVNTPQFDVEHNTACCVWSNAVYVATPSGNGGSRGYEGGDESIIAFNDFNLGDGIANSPQLYYITNHMNTIQLDGYAIHLTIMNNNLGDCRQIVHVSPNGGSDLTFIGNEYERFMGTGGMFPAFEFWNSIVHWYGGNVPGTFGITPNYTAMIGLYATNGAHLNLSEDFFVPLTTYPYWGTNFDIYSGDGTPWAQYDGGALPNVLGVMNGLTFCVHTNWGDVGAFITGRGSAYSPIPSNKNVIWQTPISEDPNSSIILGPSGSGNALMIKADQYLDSWAEFGSTPYFDQGATFLQPPASYTYGDRGGGSVTLWSQYSGDWRLTSDTTSENNFDLRGVGKVMYAAATLNATNVNNVLVGAFTGNGAGLTNLQASAIVGNYFSVPIILTTSALNAVNPPNAGTSHLWTYKIGNSGFYYPFDASLTFARSPLTNIVVTIVAAATNGVSFAAYGANLDCLTNGPSGFGGYECTATTTLNYALNGLSTNAWVFGIPQNISTNVSGYTFEFVPFAGANSNVWIVGGTITNR